MFDLDEHDCDWTMKSELHRIFNILKLLQGGKWGWDRGERPYNIKAEFGGIKPGNPLQKSKG